MEKRYKSHLTKNDYIAYAVLIAFIIGGTIWVVYRESYYLLMNVFIPAGFFLFYPNQYWLTDNNMLDVRNLAGRLFKPISVDQINSCKQIAKNVLLIKYLRDGIPGDRSLRLSEADMKDFLDELKKRNPAIEISYK